jgi:predicted TIM-barrel fold metal-dependent hydrolase
MSTGTADRTTDDDESALSLIDCDVHPYHVPEEIVEYLPTHYAEQQGFTLPQGQWANPHDGFRGDARAVAGGVPGSDPELLYEHVVEDQGADYPILNAAGVLILGTSPQADYAHALARAYNEWFIDKWLSHADCFVGGMIVAPQRPKKAAEMIREFGDHPRICQVLMSSATETPYGRRFYWPIYEAATEMGLPVGIHPGSEGRGITNSPSGAGYPTTFFEYHVDLACNYISQLVSLVSEGTLEEFPGLDFVFIEGGFTWIPTALWRLDQNYERLGDDMARLKKPPSEYVREQCWFGTQPIPEPDDWDDLRRIIDAMPAEDLLLYCSDYPHWDTDDKDAGLPRLSDEVERAMYYGNARELYDLPDDPATIG